MQNSCFPCHLEDAGQRIEREEFGLIVSFVFIFVSNLIHICFILVSYLFHLEDAPMQVKEWRREEFGLIHSCCFQWEAGHRGRRVANFHICENLEVCPGLPCPATIQISWL